MPEESIVCQWNMHKGRRVRASDKQPGLLTSSRLSSPGQLCRYGGAGDGGNVFLCPEPQRSVSTLGQQGIKGNICPGGR